ncbi:hypothetical protein [Spirosoma arcticum]
METRPLFSALLLLIVALNGCKKPETAAPVTPTVPGTTFVPFAGCRLTMAERSGSEPIRRGYTYTADGFIVNTLLTYLDSRGGTYTGVFSYSSGLAASHSGSDGTVEEYAYTNGALSKITIAKTPETAYVGYQIDVTTDASKRITRLVDSQGYQTDLTRDANGNITGLTKTKIADKSVVFQMQLSDYDGKKSIHQLYKGWPFDFLVYYGDYMTEGALLNDGAGGNPRKVRTLTDDLEYNYTYSTDGYPTSVKVFSKTSNSIISATDFTLNGCK